MAGVMFGICL